jgi:rare lipoprotein A (peptidoglycan hydrolase)
MKRIIATLLLIFISSSLTYNFIYAINKKANTKIDLRLRNNFKDIKVLKLSKPIDFNNTEKGFKKELDKNIKFIKTEVKHNIDKIEKTDHIATWYKTDGHRKVHREYSTAAYNHLPKKSRILVTNISNNKSDTVEITDRMGGTKGMRIDLSKNAFNKIGNHKTGRIIVKIKVLEIFKPKKDTL